MFSQFNNHSQCFHNRWLIDETTGSRLGRHFFRTDRQLAGSSHLHVSTP